MPTAADNQHVRIAIEKHFDTKAQMRFHATARRGERLGGSSEDTGLPYLQSYPRSAVPPAGSKAYTVSPQGNPENAAVIAAEHKDYREKNQQSGEVCDRDIWGSKMQMKSDGWHWTIGGVTMVITRAGVVTINATKIILNGFVYAGGADGSGVPAAKEGSTDNDSEDNGPDALVGNLASRVHVV